jgi:hypothetical protein
MKSGTEKQNGFRGPSVSVGDKNTFTWYYQDAVSRA